MEAILRTYEVSIGSPKERKRSKGKDKARFTHKDCKKNNKEFLDRLVPKVRS
jgi:hypothetical protein